MKNSFTIFKISFYWFGFYWKGKRWLNINDFIQTENRTSYNFSICKWNKLDGNRWGYGKFWYDGPFPHFSLGIITIHWGTMAYIVKDLQTGIDYEEEELNK